ncbi:MAG TPA: hypothetical protein VNJ08_13480 [Bacteriovoracaceae bacterium]|nr:hypothetical protein [Bacteriovoracaceae bacterium]
MKTIILALLTLTIAFEASAQRRPQGGGRVISTPRHSAGRPVGPRYNPPGRIVVRPHVAVRPHITIRPRIVVGPRYNPNPYSRRVIRTVIRPPVIWVTPFGHSCYYNQLSLNGRPVHNFSYEHECQQALQDIRIHGDFCDREDLYDQSGILEPSLLLIMNVVKL